MIRVYTTVNIAVLALSNYSVFLKLAVFLILTPEMFSCFFPVSINKEISKYSDNFNSVFSSSRYCNYYSDVTQVSMFSVNICRGDNSWCTYVLAYSRVLSCIDWPLKGQIVIRWVLFGRQSVPNTRYTHCRTGKVGWSVYKTCAQM